MPCNFIGTRHQPILSILVNIVYDEESLIGEGSPRVAYNLMTREATTDYLEKLNSEQRVAVETTEGPVLVLAGAGTGKTRVLITRLTHILSNGLAYPSQILAVTFTNKAANEMKQRVAGLMGQGSEGLWLGTFHSLAVRILRRHGELVGLKSDFTILDTDDQLRLLKQILQAHGIDDKKNPPRMVASVIGRWKDRGLTADKVKGSELNGNSLILDVYKEYQQRLLILNAADFGDLLLHCLTIFQQFPDVLLNYQQQFRYIMVDEYQDTNVAQYLWLRMLAMQNSNICCVGDDDQSIYAWRGAEIGNILRFEKDFPGATVIRLEQNYRSSSHILGAAGGLIKNNTNRLGKTLWTQTDGGDKVLVRGTWDSDDEARFIGEEIESFQRYGQSLSQMAILVRAGFQTREFEDRLLVLGVPYRVIGGLRFYERQEIRDAMAYMRLVVQPDDGLAFERIINTPRRGIGTATLQLIHTHAREQGISLTRAARQLVESEIIRGGARTAIRTFFMDVDRWRDQLYTLPHAELAALILDESGYTRMWREDKSADAPGRLENLKELVGAIKEFESLQGFLEHVSLVMDNTKQSHDDMVNIMTLHAAKGLEFDTVFLTGWEEGLFPHARSIDESGLDGLEEERRLGYVGITRARKQAIITYALNRRTFQGWQQAIPSRFIKELPAEHVRVVQASGHEMVNTRQQPRSSYNQVIPTPTNSRVFEAEYTITSNHNFKIGDRVFHQKFGYGNVENVDDENLQINFQTSGLKKIIASFVTKG